MRPSRARYGVVVFAVTLAIIQYIDRVCISKAMPSIQQELGFSNKQVGYIFSAFTLAYALFEIPTGWLGDKFGARKTLLRVTLWWSFFTIATGWVRSLWGFISVRFLFGIGEAGCFPNITKAFSTWLPASERVKAQSILWLAARWGGAFTPLLVLWILGLVGHWSRSFYVFGGLGLVWAVFFARWFKDNPQDHPSVNEEEKKLLWEGSQNLRSSHAAVPWKVFFSSKTAWFLWAQYFCLSYVWYFYVTWFPKFLDQKYGTQLSPTTLALLAGLPLFGGGFGSLISGFMANAVAARVGGMGRARQFLAATGFVLAAAAFTMGSFASNPYALALLIGLAGLFNDFVMPCAWGTCMDVGGKFAGTFSGSMNMMGNFGGVVSPIVAGYMTGDGGGWIRFFLICGGVLLIGAVAWAFVDPVKRLDQPTEAGAA